MGSWRSPQNNITTLDLVVGGIRLTPVNFGTLRGANKRIALMPHWDFFELLAGEGGDSKLRTTAAGLPAFRGRIETAVLFLSAAVRSLQDWDQVKLLSVQLDRLRQWSVPGLLCIGDTAHAMSPVFGVGVNYAVQDAVAAARLLAPALLAREPTSVALHRTLSSRGMAEDMKLRPWQARMATLGVRTAQPVMARLVGRGFLPEKLHRGQLRNPPTSVSAH